MFPGTEGNQIQTYTDGSSAYEAFEQALREATDHIHFEFYIWESDATGAHFRDLLIEKAREGVEVRVLYDAIGGARVHGRFMQPLIDAGGKAAPFLPFTLFERRLRVNFRNHRKIIVIDGTVGFTGGINIADEYREWQDMAFRLQGPAVRQLQEVFAQDWAFAAGEDIVHKRYFPSIHRDAPLVPGEETSGALAHVVASGPDLDRPNIQHAFFIAITSATSRLWITTPYFIPDHAIKMALVTAALRDVDVRLIVPGPDCCDIPMARWAARSFYEDLIRAGVKVYEYLPQILHAKLMIVDDTWTIVGSANMDIRSFRLNFEINCVIGERASNATLAQWSEQAFAQSELIDLDEFTERSKFEKFREAAIRLFSPLM